MTRSRRNKIHHLEINGATLVVHDDKTPALTGYYTDILGRATTTAWGFNLQALYSDEAKVEGA